MSIQHVLFIVEILLLYHENECRVIQNQNRLIHLSESNSLKQKDSYWTHLPNINLLNAAKTDFIQYYYSYYEEMTADPAEIIKPKHMEESVWTDPKTKIPMPEKMKAFFKTASNTATGDSITQSYIHIDAQNQFMIHTPHDGSDSLIKWHDVDKKFNDEEWSKPFIRAIGFLRVETLEYLLKEVTGDTVKDVYYKAFGSTKETSDLDFTYSDWNEPVKVVEYMLKFYNEFKNMYGNIPPITFDMNYYLASGILDAVGYVSLDKALQPLFQKVIPGVHPYHAEGQRHDIYVLGNYHDNAAQRTFKKYDQFISWLLIKEKRKDLATGKTEDDKFKDFAVYSKVFWWIITQIKEGEVSIGSTIQRDYSLLLLNALLIKIKLNSNEAYSTLQALSEHGNGASSTAYFDEFDAYLSYLDNFVFIDECVAQSKVQSLIAKELFTYALGSNRASKTLGMEGKKKVKSELYKHKYRLLGIKIIDIDDFIVFYDRISKYVMRLWKSIERTEVGRVLVQHAKTHGEKSAKSILYDQAKIWREEIRGSVPLKSIKEAFKQKRGFAVVESDGSKVQESVTDPKKQKAIEIIMKVYAYVQPKTKGIGFTSTTKLLFDVLNKHRDAIEGQFEKQREFYLQTNHDPWSKSGTTKWEQVLSDIDKYVRKKAVYKDDGKIKTCDLSGENFENLIFERRKQLIERTVEEKPKRPPIWEADPHGWGQLMVQGKGLS
eukprot:342479_1